MGGKERDPPPVGWDMTRMTKLFIGTTHTLLANQGWKLPSRVGVWGAPSEHRDSVTTMQGGGRATGEVWLGWPGRRAPMERNKKNILSKVPYIYPTKICDVWSGGNLTGSFYRLGTRKGSGPAYLT
jgi:hypothetical protein